MSSGDRKRNRWGSTSDAVAADSQTVSAVPDDAAIRALLGEAEARQESRSRKPIHDRGSSSHSARNVSNKRYDGDTSSNRRSQGEKTHEESYYGPQDTDAPSQQPGEEDGVAVEKEKPNFGVSGALAKDSKAGNMYRGVLLKFREPPEARAPNTLWVSRVFSCQIRCHRTAIRKLCNCASMAAVSRWLDSFLHSQRLYVYKGDDIIETLHINRQSAYLCGRNADIADIPLLHPSCSSQHAVIQFRALADAETGKLNTQPYLMDLESANGTFLNGIPLDSARYYQLKRGDVIKFGCSTREYVLLTANTKKL